MNLREKRWGYMKWINLAQKGTNIVGLCEHGNALSGSINCWVILE
jgi:hypothetical protein